MDFRVDRLAALYVARPLMRYVAKSISVPILMYHSVADHQDTAMHPYYRTVTSPQVFGEQMQYLHDNGYHTIGLGELSSRFEHGIDSAKCVIITFDDGYSDFYTHAFAILEKHGFTATVFLPTNFIGNYRLRFKGKCCMSWNEARELRKLGISFGSHTVTHPQLRSLDEQSANEELVASKRTIEQELGSVVESFAYPFAFPEHEARFKTRLRESLRRSGYLNGVCTSIGRVDRNADRFFMRRLPVNSCDDVRLFEAKLAGAYDWVFRPQYWVKMAKACEA
jgi:peptidoglycan/xylan/chitin deacetylase (PgdA/CDA1 family)